MIQKIYSGIIWRFPGDRNRIFLSFDDGPHPEITPWILGQLKKYDAKATFFCLGKNAEKYPGILQKIIDEGHSVGNHGYEHLNSWKISVTEFEENIRKGEEILNTRLFRPPYGKIRISSQLAGTPPPYQGGSRGMDYTRLNIINWSLMPGDFDQDISSEKCYQNLIKNVRGGDIICLHDSEKARKHLEYCLPKWLEDLKMYKLERIS